MSNVDNPGTGKLDVASAVKARTDVAHGAVVKHRYRCECRAPDGTLRWVEEFDNLVVAAGLNKYLDATLKTGLASPAWYVGLVGASPTYNAADTMSSHAGWTTNTAYGNATNPAWTPGSIASGSVDNSGSPAVFNINATTTIEGAFLSDSATKGGTSGTLLGVGSFSAARTLYNLDTLTVTVTCSLAAS